MIGKGPKEKGTVWVAVRIPDDCIACHANQSRIHKFDLKDKQNVMYAKDVITFARKQGFSVAKTLTSLLPMPTLPLTLVPFATANARVEFLQ